VVALDEAGQFDCQANGTRPPPSTADSAKWTLAFYLGGTRTVPSTLTISQPQRRNRMTFDPVHFSGKSFDGPVYYGARVRYQFGGIPWFGVETEFIHSKVYADTRQSVHVAGQRDGQPISRRVLLQEIVQQYSISHGVNLLLFNAAFSIPSSIPASASQPVFVYWASWHWTDRPSYREQHRRSPAGTVRMGEGSLASIRRHRDSDSQRANCADGVQVHTDKPARKRFFGCCPVPASYSSRRVWFGLPVLNLNIRDLSSSCCR
jgi:hypothetical protein